jgi:hypothetical protein
VEANVLHAETRSARGDESLPRLLDSRSLRNELGISRAAAEAIMRQLPVIEPPGLRKVYVRRTDVHRFLEGCLRFR